MTSTQVPHQEEDMSQCAASSQPLPDSEPAQQPILSTSQPVVTTKAKLSRKACMKGVDLQGDRNMTDRKRKALPPLDNSHRDSFGCGDKHLIRPLLLHALEDIQPQLEAIQDTVYKLRVHKVIRPSRLEPENLMCHAIAQEFCNEIEATYPIPQNATVRVHINLRIAEAALQTSHLQDAIDMDDNGVLHIRKGSVPSRKRPKVDSDSDCCIVGTKEAKPIVFKPIMQASIKYLTSHFRLPCSSHLPYVNEGATAKGPPLKCH